MSFRYLFLGVPTMGTTRFSLGNYLFLTGKQTVSLIFAIREQLNNQYFKSYNSPFLSVSLTKKPLR